jgi:hypothetical protein
MASKSESLTQISERTRWQRLAPAFVLVVLAPLVAEVLSGATRLSFIFAFVPEVMVWGVGALIIRELAVRWRSGWSSVLLMGLGLSVAEEFVIQQTSIAPLPWLATAAVYGRLWGVNWVYFLFMLGYESVWVVLVPTLLVRLIFPQRRDEPWLRPRGWVWLAGFFLLGSFMAWYAWTQRARPMVFHVPKYQPPAITILAGVLTIVLLFLAAYRLRSRADLARTVSGRAPSPWIVGLGTLVMGFPWYVLIGLVFVPRMGLPLWIPLVGGCVWALLSYLLVRHWAGLPGWQEMHEWALVFAAILVCMVAGFSGSSTWPRADMVAKLILNVVASAGMASLALKIRKRTAA